MSARFFFERFWEAEQKNELFVCMPFHDSLDEKFNKIDKAAREKGFEQAMRVKEDWDSNVITDKIFGGIANSKMLLFDLSDDPKLLCIHSKQASANVIYELGIANAIREPQDILLIRKKSSSDLPFDIKSMTINEYSDDLMIEWLAEKLGKVLNNQEWHKSKRAKAVAESIDDISLNLMQLYGRRPKGFNHFNTSRMPIAEKASVHRLIDLGILRFECKCYEKGSEHAYHWTPFGYEVIKHLRIRMFTMDEFKKKPEYKEVLKATKKWEEDIKKIRAP